MTQSEVVLAVEPEVVQPIVKKKTQSDMTKISAKCATCHRRLFRSDSKGTVCKNGHAITYALVTHTPKGTVVTKAKASRAQ